MNLQAIVSVTGKGGLFKVIGKNKSGFILESLDEAKTKIITGSNQKLATLNDITIFGTSDDLTLKSIFENIDKAKDTNPIPDAKSEPAILKKYFAEISPEHDPERVYGSDIKKIVSWYSILSVMPLFTEAEVAEEDVKLTDVAEPVKPTYSKNATNSKEQVSDKSKGAMKKTIKKVV